MNSTGVEISPQIAIGRDEEAKLAIYEQVRQWQMGDLISNGHFPERRLIINLTKEYIEVIAESGWWNRYPACSDVPILFHGNTGLVYSYVGRGVLSRDFLSGVFTQYFRTHEQ